MQRAVLRTAAGPKAAVVFGALLWPTGASDCITSTFGEFREAHFHSGIDISTHGRTGFPCYAVESGDVSRLRISCRGYGKVVYLRLDDGRTAVYAHLSEFAGALADTARAIQQSLGTVHFDREFPKGALRVERGQVIAKTGESGAGIPHLHFELRDEQERALDPLAHGIQVEDAKPPRVTRISLTPLTPESSVDGDSRTVIVDVDREHGIGIADRIVPVAGRIGIAVEGIDSTDPCVRRLAVKKWELKEGNATLFAVDTDRFTFDEWDLIDLHFDPRYSYAGKGHFMSLWRRPGNDFPAVAGDWPAADGVAGDAGRMRTFTIAAIDAAGNRSEASVTLSFSAPQSPGELLTIDTMPPADDPGVLQNYGAWIEHRPVAGGRAVRRVMAAAQFSPDVLPVTSALVRGNSEGRISSDDSLVEVRFPAGTLREDTIVLLRERDSLAHSKELRPVGTLHQIDTGMVPLAGSYEINARVPPDFEGDGDALALYVHGGSSFRYIGGAGGKERFSATTQRASAFGLFEDVRPPTIGSARIVRRGRDWRIELRVREGGSGIECDDIQVFADGRRLLHEYDSETALVSAYLEPAPLSGRSIDVRIDAADRVGNSSSDSQTLRARK